MSKTQPGFFGLHVDKAYETHVELLSGEAVGMGVVEISARPVVNFEEYLYFSPGFTAKTGLALLRQSTLNP